VFEDTTPVFTDAARVRACLKCSLVEVAPSKASPWIVLDEYVQHSMAKSRTAQGAD
jgi:hypothetical protein